MVNCGAVVAANAIIIYDQLRATKERKMHYFMEKWSLSALHQENQNHHRLYEFDIRIIITVGQSSIACLAAIVTKHKAYIVAFGAEYVLVLLHIHAMNEIILSFTLLYQLILILLLLLLALQLQRTAFSFWAFSFSCLNFQMIRLLARCCALWILWHTFRWKLLFLSLFLLYFGAAYFLSFSRPSPDIDSMAAVVVFVVIVIIVVVLLFFHLGLLAFS